MKLRLSCAICELESHELQVGLAPLRWPMNEGGMRRVVLDQNPKWYRILCSRHLSSRPRSKPDTIIKRRSVLSILNQLLHHGYSRSKYAAEIISLLPDCQQPTS